MVTEAQIKAAREAFAAKVDEQAKASAYSMIWPIDWPTGTMDDAFRSALEAAGVADQIASWVETVNRQNEIIQRASVATAEADQRGYQRGLEKAAKVVEDLRAPRGCSMDYDTAIEDAAEAIRVMGQTTGR